MRAEAAKPIEITQFEIQNRGVVAAGVPYVALTSADSLAMDDSIEPVIIRVNFGVQTPANQRKREKTRGLLARGREYCVSGMGAAMARNAETDFGFS